MKHKTISHLKSVRYILIMILLASAMTIRAQKFYNLTAQQVKIDSVAPTFACAIPLSGDYADSVYTVSIAYPEYIDMTAADVARYRLATHDVQPGASPLITQHIVTMPLHLYLTDEDVRKIIRVVNDFVK